MGDNDFWNIILFCVFSVDKFRGLVGKHYRTGVLILLLPELLFFSSFVKNSIKLS